MNALLLSPVAYYAMGEYILITMHDVTDFVVINQYV